MKSSLMRKTSMRYFAGATAMAASLSLVACGGGEKASGDFDGEVKVGILHSRSGTMAISENTVAEAELMAIEEINAKGGITIDGKKLRIVSIEEDGASDWPTFAEKATKLIDQDHVAMVFGGWTSASRKAMLPILRPSTTFFSTRFSMRDRNVPKTSSTAALLPINRLSLPSTSYSRTRAGQGLIPGGL